LFLRFIVATCRGKDPKKAGSKSLIEWVKTHERSNMRKRQLGLRCKLYD
jgi:hypothetical protein